MDSNKRFDQLESLLVDLARKQDQQSEQIANILRILSEHGKAINSLGELLNSHTGVLNSHTDVLNSHTASFVRQEQRLDDIGEQIGSIINILKLSEARHAATEQRQDAMLAEVQRLGKRTDASVEAVRLLLKRQENTDTRLDGMVQTQLQMLQLQRLDADKLDDLGRRLPAAEGQEPRIKRLEDEVFRAAS